jgi:glycosyltransferase involved in cell wall biosynthesis
MTLRTVEAGVPPARIRTVPNWVPGERVRPLDPADSVRRREWNPDGRMAVMYSGNLGLGHELESLVEALRELGPEAPVRALFVGDGKMRQPLEKRVRDLGLQRSVTFHPPQPLADLCDSLAAGDVHLVSQRPGTQGLIVPSKLYGVLAAGRAILYVGPEDTHVAQVVRNSGAGVRVANGDVAALAEALRGLAADPAGRAEMGRRGRLYYERHFGRDRSVPRIVAAIEGRPDLLTEA